MGLIGLDWKGMKQQKNEEETRQDGDFGAWHGWISGNGRDNNVGRLEKVIGITDISIVHTLMHEC